MNRTNIIQSLIDTYRLTSYLEIGCQNDVNFNAIRCDRKVGVDPEKGGTHRMTSDEFFAGSDEKFDLIFIDGLHEAHQVRTDLINAHARAKYIVVHDLLPINERMQQVPRIAKQWTGDGWKAWQALHSNFFVCYIVNTDFGVGVIKTDSASITRWPKIDPRHNWKFFLEVFKKEQIIKTPEQFLKDLA